MIYPPEFTEYCKNANLKGAFVREIKPSHPRDCHNCGGVGSIVIFLVTEGPFEFPPNGCIEPRKGERQAKFITATYVNGKWWGGMSQEKNCPVCHGSGILPGWEEQPISIDHQQLDTFDMLKKTKPIEVEDYTDR